MLLRIFLVICLIYKANALAVDELSEDEYIQKEEELTKEAITEDSKINFMPKTKSMQQAETCTFYQNANLQITNKMEGRTYIQNVKIKEDFTLEFLKIKLTKCCKTEAENSYAFARVYNSKINKEVFAGWIFSSLLSKNPIEDAKFDITLLQCF